MRKNALVFLCLTLLFSGCGMLLRRWELNAALDRSTMLMDFHPLSLALLLVSALALGYFALCAVKTPLDKLPAAWGSVFRGLPTLIVSAAAMLLMLAGALLTFKERGSGADGLLSSLLALLAALGGVGWLALALDAYRGVKRVNFLPAVLPVLFVCAFLIVFYKTYAHQPALLYTLYSFLGLCAALLGLHMAAGFTVKKLRPRLTLFFSGAGTYLCAVGLMSTEETAYRLFFLAMALMLLLQGVCMVQYRPSGPAQKEA